MSDDNAPWAGVAELEAVIDRGQELDRIGRPQEAREYFERALALDPGNVAALTGMGMVTYQLGDDADAKSWFEQAHRAGSGVGARNLAHILLGEGDEAAAELWLREAVDRGDTVAMRSLASLLLAPVRTGQFPEEVARGFHAENDGRTLLRRACDAGDVHAAYLLGVFLESQRDRDKAVVWYVTAARSGDPDAAEACRRLKVPVDGIQDRQSSDGFGRWWRRRKPQ